MMAAIYKEMQASKQREEERVQDEKERRIDEEEKRQSDEEKRQKERQEDRKERMDDILKIKEGVKVEMMEVMKPWQERTTRVEESVVMLGEEMKKAVSDLKELKERMEERQEVRQEVRQEGRS